VSSFLPSLHNVAILCDRSETFTASSLPNDQLSPEALTLAMHAPPDDAVCIHKDVRSRATMGIHFATFVGSEDEVRLFGHLHLHVSPRRVTTRSHPIVDRLSLTLYNVFFFHPLYIGDISNYAP
jgi:hypothetical protein